MTELCSRSAIELAAMIRSREVSSREVIYAHLARIEESNPAVNASRSTPTAGTTSTASTLGAPSNRS
jgi:amidase